MFATFKQFTNWLTVGVIGILISLLTYFGNRIIDGQDKMNETLTTILVQQQDLNRRITVLETAKTENEQRWKDQEERVRVFYQTYDLKRKQ
ncbi:hypothetical protein [Solirubrum puertoriconensis]|uniref:Uncharacterized protein n=1 Tax=Solirubrum puertoriconensis TaxID=1751427 RepID=A0A9X0HK69_SOLP1|nr:hypothetical protein [Solirubrum puertoriconensis]KUG07415.1 hypothetical protein ASU33_13765 [Solirubrum puertoriconensis]